MIDKNLISSLEALPSPQDVIKKIFTDFGNKAAIGTSGQLTGTVMIDMACQAGIKPRIFTLDTLRLFPETYSYFNDLEKHYGVVIERLKPDPQKISKMISQHGEYLFFDSKEKQEYCCHLRKVEPQEKILETLDVWLTGLRKDQSESRKETKRFETISTEVKKHPVLKVAPLLDFTEKDLREYVQKNKVPIHPLFNWNQNGWYYESFGCVICTTPIGPHEQRRAGRWRWFNTTDQSGKKECGIHTSFDKEEEKI